MSFERQFNYQQQENKDIITSLIEDGSDPDAIYVMEHHLSCHDKLRIEAVCQAYFKAGYEVQEMEELMLDDGAKVYGFDVVIEQILQVDRINEDCKQLMQIAMEHDVQYDGWGTYFINASDEDDFDDVEEDF